MPMGAFASGVGFLGAGVILHDGATVRGLSTAATHLQTTFATTSSEA